MNNKELKLVITFHTIADAMALEKACKENKTCGRLISVPRSLSSSCGISWCTGLENKDKTLDIISKYQIEYEGIYEIIL
ncbi:MAG TPA: DUF3343 domain-containing protein [Haloplasmataceae bacterium]